MYRIIFFRNRWCVLTKSLTFALGLSERQCVEKVRARRGTYSARFLSLLLYMHACESATTNRQTSHFSATIAFRLFRHLARVRLQRHPTFRQLTSSRLLRSYWVEFFSKAVLILFWKSFRVGANDYFTKIVTTLTRTALASVCLFVSILTTLNYFSPFTNYLIFR